MEIKGIHDSCNTFLKNVLQSEKDIDANMNNEEAFIDLNINRQFKDNFLNQIDSTLNNINHFRNSLIENFYNNPDNQEYLRSMDEVFGSIDSLVNECEEHIQIMNTKLLNLKEKIRENENLVPDEDEIKEVHERLRQFQEAMTTIIDESNKLLNDKESLEQLRIDSAQRQNMKKLITQSYSSIENIKEYINTIQSDKKKLERMSYYNFKYGNLGEKMNNILDDIEKSTQELDNVMEYIERIEKNYTQHQNNNQPNYGRRIDF